MPRSSNQAIEPTIVLWRAAIAADYARIVAHHACRLEGLPIGKLEIGANDFHGQGCVQAGGLGRRDDRADAVRGGASIAVMNRGIGQCADQRGR